MSDDEEPVSWVEHLVAELAHTHHCTALYCLSAQRTFLPGDKIADVLYGLRAFGTMHQDCARVFRLHWMCRARAGLN